MSSIENSSSSVDSKLENVNSSDIKLPSEWCLYLYDKQIFAKMAQRVVNATAPPNEMVHKLTNLSDLIYLTQLMEVKIKTENKFDHRINLDMHNYIIMRKDIQPVWEDPRNRDGGAFTIKIRHSKGYSLWYKLITRMIGETLMYNIEKSQSINGITVSYIQGDSDENCFTYIKIWDGKQGRTKEDFIGLLPSDIINEFKGESPPRYIVHREKQDFDGKIVMNNLHNYNNKKAQKYNKYSNFK